MMMMMSVDSFVGI